MLKIVGSKIMPLKCEEVKIDKASKNRKLKINEALHIQLTPDNNKLNREKGFELPGCWLSMLHVVILQNIINSKRTLQ